MYTLCSYLDNKMSSHRFSRRFSQENGRLIVMAFRLCFFFDTLEVTK